MTWEDFADGTRIQKKSDGGVHYIYKGASHDVQQYSQMPDGTEITYYNDQRRYQVFPNGTTLEVNADKSRIQTNPDGVKIETQENGYTLQTNPNGSTLETFPDGELLTVDFPLANSPAGESLEWPEIKRVQRSSTSTHYVAADGTDIQVDPDGGKIVRWAVGHAPTADKHYAETGQEWCLKVDPEGRTDYLIKEATETTQSGTTSTVWTVDGYWREQAEAELAAQEAKDAAAKKRAADKAAAEAAAAKAEADAAAKAKADAAAEAAANDAELQKKLEEDRIRVEREYILNKYKLYPFIKMKNFLKSNGIPKDAVDNCLGKYELKKLAEAHNVELPDDPKAL